MPLLEEAIKIALEAHKGRLDKAGDLYILHPLRVMCRMETEQERIAAVLHDVVEDSSWTLQMLREKGFGEDVIEALDRLTRRENESYEDFIQRASAHGLSRRIKKADLEDNMDIRRLANVTQGDLERLQKYLNAWRSLDG